MERWHGISIRLKREFGRLFICVFFSQNTATKKNKSNHDGDERTTTILRRERRKMQSARSIWWLCYKTVKQSDRETGLEWLVYEFNLIYLCVPRLHSNGNVFGCLSCYFCCYCVMASDVSFAVYVYSLYDEYEI